MTRHIAVTGPIAICLLGALLVFADDENDSRTSERSVKQTEVPASALAGIKKVAGESCECAKLQIGVPVYERLRCVGDWPCPGCGVRDGGVHHYLCDREVCQCEGKLVACDCFRETDE